MRRIIQFSNRKRRTIVGVTLGGLALLVICLDLFMALGARLYRPKEPVLHAQCEEAADGSLRVSSGGQRTFGFDGLGNRVLAPDATGFHFGTNEDFSVEAWIRAYPLSSEFAKRLGAWIGTHPSTAKLAPQWILSWISAHSIDNDFGVTPVVDKHRTPSPFESIGFQLYLDAGRLACQLSTAPMRQLTFQNFVSPGPNLQDGHWHYVAMSVVRNSVSGGKLYVDGQQVFYFDPTQQNGDLSNSEPLRIGNHANPSLRCRFKGLIGNVAVYRRARSAQEVAETLRAGHPRQ